MNIVPDFYSLGFSLIFALFLALLRGDQVEIGFQVRGAKVFLRYRRNRRK